MMFDEYQREEKKEEDEDEDSGQTAVWLKTPNARYKSLENEKGETIGKKLDTTK